MVAERVAQTMRLYAAQRLSIRAAMLARLGPVVWHSSPANAMATLEELEETARLWLLSEPKPALLSEVDIQELRDTFSATW